MIGLKKVEEIVEKILDVRQDARENDDILYLYACEYFHRGISSMSLKNFLTTRKATGCPDVASVKRARRKVFERRPELKPPKITELREEMVEVFVDYAINS